MAGSPLKSRPTRPASGSPAAISTASGSRGIPIEKLSVSAYTIPTDLPEADGTFAWNKTTMVLVEVTAGSQTGLGYTYADTCGGYLSHPSSDEIGSHHRVTQTGYKSRQTDHSKIYERTTCNQVTKPELEHLPQKSWQ